MSDVPLSKYFVGEATLVCVENGLYQYWRKKNINISLVSANHYFKRLKLKNKVENTKHFYCIV